MSSITTQDRVASFLSRGTIDGFVTLAQADRFGVGAQVVVGTDPKSRIYKVIGNDGSNQVQLAEFASGVPANLSQWLPGTRIEVPTQTLPAGAVAPTASDLTRNRLGLGGLLQAPSSASTQATGAGGALAWRVGMDIAQAGVVNGKIIQWAAGDITVYSGATLVINGQSIWGAICLVTDPGSSDGLVAVTGVAATTGSQVRMTDAAVQAALLVAKPTMTGWARLGDCLLNRTGDTTVTQSQDNSTRMV